MTYCLAADLPASANSNRRRFVSHPSACDPYPRHVACCKASTVSQIMVNIHKSHMWRWYLGGERPIPGRLVPRPHGKCVRTLSFTPQPPSSSLDRYSWFNAAFMNKCNDPMLLLLRGTHVWRGGCWASAGLAEPEESSSQQQTRASSIQLHRQPLSSARRVSTGSCLASSLMAVAVESRVLELHQCKLTSYRSCCVMAKQWILL